ncbi:MAG: hypothetical protein DWQ51_18240 [Microcystis wesenbergii TW10]|jgi:hypothetical protein|uniref:Nuclear transport factor 2 family protein n=2 Tax=Microcystis TaxID=1125 RepID=A0A552ARZ1_MICAE|nr:MAG: hypothetical protein DWQ51_18240 [Microcystis wesenbergii TW10]TRT88241.1 MAG: hypothetical protein EWV63_06435 [Microcystis aeruginosa Ma_OC_H_19870700_S124]
MSLVPLTEGEVKELVDVWYQKLDVHAPLEEMLPLLAGEELEMQLPETTLYGLNDFKGWYEGVIRTFFDEVHTMQELNISVTPDGDKANVKLVVRWEASRWPAPAPHSQRLAFDAAQTWVIVRSPTTEQAVIKTYIVDKFTPLPGYPPL